MFNIIYLHEVFIKFEKLSKNWRNKHCQRCVTWKMQTLLVRKKLFSCWMILKHLLNLCTHTCFKVQNSFGTVVRVRTKQTGDKMWMKDGWRNIDTTKFINFLFCTIKKGIEHSKLFLDDDSVLTNLRIDFICFCQWKDI